MGFNKCKNHLTPLPILRQEKTNSSFQAVITWGPPPGEQPKAQGALAQPDPPLWTQMESPMSNW